MSFELIETVTVGAGGASSIEFTSIPQDGTDLLVVVSPRLDVAGTFSSILTRFNADTGANYSTRRLSGNGASVSSSSRTSENQFDQININADLSTANTFSSNQVYISNYASSTDKSVSIDSVTENNDTSSNQVLQAGKYATTSGITSILFYTTSNFVANSTASLYKITAS